jgi:hypothetical protein
MDFTAYDRYEVAYLYYEIRKDLNSRKLSIDEATYSDLLGTDIVGIIIPGDPSYSLARSMDRQLDQLPRCPTKGIWGISLQENIYIGEEA